MLWTYISKLINMLGLQVFQRSNAPKFPIDIRMKYGRSNGSRVKVTFLLLRYTSPIKPILGNARGKNPMLRSFDAINYIALLVRVGNSK